MARPILCVLVLLLSLGLAPQTVAGDRDDAYLAGYASAVLERQFGINPRSVEVKDGVLTLSAADLPRGDRTKILEALSSISGITRVDVREPVAAKPGAPVAPPPAQGPKAELLPSGHLFKTILADPRWPDYSASYRYYLGNPDLKSVAAVSFGETLPIYRRRIDPVEQWGQWELGFQAGVFSTFDVDADSTDLLNTDFFVAAFAAYKNGPFSTMVRLLHQSSHLGDELLLRSTHPNRINLSYDGVDAKLSYELPFGFRVYGGGGYLFYVDPTSLGRGSLQVGAEFSSPEVLWGGRIRPIAGLDLQFREENRWATDLSLRAGIQLESVSVLNRNLQLLFEYFNGHSFEGQFFSQPVEYLGFSARFNF